MFRIYKAYLIALALMSFLSTPNAFINPTWAIIMWAMTLQVLWWNHSDLKWERELLRSQDDNRAHLKNRSKTYLIELIEDLDEEFATILRLNTAMFNALVEANIETTLEFMNERVERNIEVVPQYE